MKKDKDPIDVVRAVKDYAVSIVGFGTVTLLSADMAFYLMHERHLHGGEAAIVAFSLAGSGFAIGTEVIELHPKEEDHSQIDFENWGSE